MISNLMIFLASLQSFILNLFMSWSFNHSKALILFDLRARLSTYTSMMMSSPFFLIVRIQISVLVDAKPIFWRNLVLVLFQSFIAYFNS